MKFHESAQIQIRGQRQSRRAAFRWAMLLLGCVLSPRSNSRAEQEWIVVADDSSGFVTSKSKTPFYPLGFNYDHDRDGRLIEDYWNDEWSTIEEDFAEMKALGANVARIHLQFAKFMNSPSQANPAALARLTQLVQLAEKLEIYLDLTGLGCYHKADVPAWYDGLSESDRWKAQREFWSAIAQTCQNSPAVFCYDLMNEPVSPAGEKPAEDWLGPAFAGKHFVQRIGLAQNGRPRPVIAKAWIETLSAAIREHDTRHLITVGLVPWSLDKPGLTSGFVPKEIVGSLDFVCVHLYPSSGKLAEELETLTGFCVGKPVLIEETFPLKCSAEEFAEFVQKSRGDAAGLIGFYWGKTRAECGAAGTIADQMMIGWLDFFTTYAAQRPAR